MIVTVIIFALTAVFVSGLAGVMLGATIVYRVRLGLSPVPSIHLPKTEVEVEEPVDEDDKLNLPRGRA